MSEAFTKPLMDSGNRREFDSGAVRDMEAGKGRCDLLPACALLRLSRHYEAGANKYSARNWEKGVPISVMLDSGLRHLFKYLDGRTDEDHLAAAAWNILSAMWMEEKRPDQQDLEVRKTASQVGDEVLEEMREDYIQKSKSVLGTIEESRENPEKRGCGNCKYDGLPSGPCLYFDICRGAPKSIRKDNWEPKQENVDGRKKTMQQELDTRNIASYVGDEVLEEKKAYLQRRAATCAHRIVSTTTNEYFHCHRTKECDVENNYQLWRAHSEYTPKEEPND